MTKPAVTTVRIMACDGAEIAWDRCDSSHEALALARTHLRAGVFAEIRSCRHIDRLVVGSRAEDLQMAKRVSHSPYGALSRLELRLVQAAPLASCQPI